MAAVNWRLRLSKARDLKKKGVELLFDRVHLLVLIFNDTEFRQACADDDQNELDLLDAVLSDVGCTFLTLKEVYERHPEKTEWVKHDLRELIADAMAAGKKEKEPTQKTDWKAMYLDTKEQLKLLEVKYESLIAKAEWQEKLLEKSMETTRR